MKQKIDPELMPRYQTLLTEAAMKVIAEHNLQNELMTAVKDAGERRGVRDVFEDLPGFCLPAVPEE